MFGRSAIVVVFLAVAFVATVALACGPFFPWQLLDARDETLKQTPTNTFAFEAAHLTPAPKDKLKAVEIDSFNDPSGAANALTNTENAGVSHEESEQIYEIRHASDDASGMKAGQGLPPAILHYTVGALDFHNGNPQAAIDQFQSVLALSDKDKRPRAVWAAYMLGKTFALSGDQRADQMFQLARELGRQGLPDPLGLAVASYGEQAKVQLQAANAELTPPPPSATPTPQPSDDSNPPQATPIDTKLVGYTLAPEHDGAYRFELSNAVKLYAEQAARGSDNAVQSLRIIAENVTSDPTRMNSAVVEPVLQRLLIVYALARVQDMPGHDAMKPDAGIREPGTTVNPLLPALITAIEAAQTTKPAYYDRLAALAYRTGRYDLAEQMARKGQSPLAQWVLAKLAIQKGDLAAGEKYLAAAAHGFPAAKIADDLDSDNRNLVQGEGGSVALARGEYLDALDKLYPVASTYWGDVAYIAERVLTTDELKGFVDAKVPEAAYDPKSSNNLPEPPADLLRELLARRLMRDGRTDEALDYFVLPDNKKDAQAYVDALNAGGSDWGRVDRAEALFNAAMLARHSGLNILGTEADPDYANLSGEYDTGVGQSDPKGAYVTKDERKRFDASKPKPNLRFHYRYVAVDEANAAADLLPARSQAFAAVLCAATGWMMETPGEDKRVHALYRRYVKQGAYVPWAKSFGQKCAKPDFAGAIYYERVQPFREARHYAGKHKVVSVSLAGFTLALVLLIVLYAVGVLPRVKAVDDTVARMLRRKKGAPPEAKP